METTEKKTPIHADFSVSNDTVCIGDTVLLKDLSNCNSCSITQWHWDMGDGSTASSSIVTKKYTSAKAYNVSFFFTTDKNCISDTMTKEVIVAPLPVVSAGPDLILPEGVRTILRAVATGNMLHYFWKDNSLGYLDNDTVLQPLFTAVKDMAYKFVVTSKEGCVASDSIYIKVLLKLQIPNVFSPNGDGINDIWEIKNLSDYSNSRVQVYNRYGQLIYHSIGYSQSWDGTINGKPLPIGTYYYLINTDISSKPLSGTITILR